MSLVSLRVFAVVVLLSWLPVWARAGIVKGIVSGADQAPLAFANVAVRGAATSTGANEQGRYQLRLPAGQYELVFQYVGYKPRIEAVRVPGGDSAVVLNVALQAENYNLGEVLVRSSDRDPAYAIIQQAQQWRAYHRREVAAYRARIYLKSVLRVIDTPAKIMGLFKIGPDIKKGILYLSESLSEISVTQPNQVRERMISSRVSGDSRGLSFNRASAGRNLTFYENLVKPGFAERGFVSPIAANAMLFYKYELVGSTTQGGVVVNKIKVIPRRRKPDLRGLNAQVRKQVKQAQRDSIKNDPFARMPRGEVQLVEKGVNERDSSYWDQVRPVPLTAEEKKDYKVKDSTEVIRRSRPYQDSMDRKRNEFQLAGLLIGGVGHINSFKKQSFSVQPLTQIFQYNTVEGAVLNAQATFRRYTDDRRFVTLTPTLRYGFSSRQLNPSLELAWQLDPAKRRQIGLIAGRTIENFDKNSQLTPLINTVYTLLANYNYAKLYRRDGMEVSYLSEALNGLTLRATAAYFDRHELYNTTDRLIRNSTERLFTPNTPVSEELPTTSFGRSRILTVGLSADFKPGQRYINRPDGKFNLGSKWPTFNVQGRLAVPHVLGADVRYLVLQAGVRHSLALGLLGASAFRVNVGGFVGKQEGMTFIDYRHFAGNQTILAGNFSNFQLLDYYRFSTNSTYLEAHYDHHFNGFIFNKIPLFRKLKWQEVASLNYLHTAQASHYVELGAGVEHIFKLVRVDFYTALQSGQRLGTGLRVGIGF